MAKQRKKKNLPLVKGEFVLYKHSGNSTKKLLYHIKYDKSGKFYHYEEEKSRGKRKKENTKGDYIVVHDADTAFNICQRLNSKKFGSQKQKKKI